MDTKVPPRRTRASAPKVKTGCKTCKARKIKCDEARPSCERCQRFGIQCDGYAPIPLTKAQRTALLKQKDARDAREGRKPKTRIIVRAPAAQLFDNDQEYGYFQHFCNETAVQLSAAFETDLWKRVVLQTSETEPAIRHAVTAIGALNLKSVATGGDEADRLRCEFAYKEYGLAISGIRRRTMERRADIRTKLLACILFTCFESYHGDSIAATRQTFAGIDMMNEYLSHRKPRPSDDTWAGTSTLTLPPIDQDITDALLNLEIQSCAFSDPRSTEFHLERMHAWQTAIDNMPLEFRTIKQARLALHQIMLRGIHFILATKREAGLQAVADAFHALNPDSCNIDPQYTALCAHFTEFHAWHTAFGPLLRKARTPGGRHMFKSATLLELHYLACYLWLATSAPIGMYYTRYTRELTEIVRLVKSLLGDGNGGGIYDEPNFALDTRLVMALNTVGLRYRHRALRREVMEILGRADCPTHDGVWDGKMVGSIMGFMAEVEEEGLPPIGDGGDGGFEYVPEEWASSIIDLQIDMGERTTYVVLLLPSKVAVGDVELRERNISW